MSQSGGGRSSSEAETMRGRSWPSLRQFCVFLENHVGSLHDLLRHLEQADLRICALSIADSIDFAIARVLVSNYERAVELLDLSGFSWLEVDVLCVELPDDPKPYVRICLALLQAELNINYTYPLLFRPHGRDAIVLNVDDVDAGVAALGERGLRVVTEADLLDDDGF